MYFLIFCGLLRLNDLYHSGFLSQMTRPCLETTMELWVTHAHFEHLGRRFASELSS